MNEQVIIYKENYELISSLLAKKDMNFLKDYLIICLKE